MYILHYLDLTDDYGSRIKGRRRVDRKKKEEVFKEMPIQPRTFGYRKNNLKTVDVHTIV
jgi:hypothetical protein